MSCKKIKKNNKKFALKITIKFTIQQIGHIYFNEYEEGGGGGGL